MGMVASPQMMHRLVSTKMTCRGTEGVQAGQHKDATWRGAEGAHGRVKQKKDLEEREAWRGQRA